MLQLREVYRDGYVKRFAEDWRSGKYPRYLLGTNKLAHDIAKAVGVEGFINTVSAEDEFLGKPVFHFLTDVPVDALVVMCNVQGKVNQVEAWLSQYSFRHLEAPRFARHMGLEVVIPYFSGFAEDIKEHADEYVAIYEHLADNESRDVFYNLVNYRLSGDWRYLRGFTDRRDEQYFEGFLHLPEAPVFADIGGYQGETTLEFIKRNPGYKHIYFFEPEVVNMACAQQNLKNCGASISLDLGVLTIKGKSGLRLMAVQAKSTQTTAISGEGRISISINSMTLCRKELIT